MKCSGGENRYDRTSRVGVFSVIAGTSPYFMGKVKALDCKYNGTLACSSVGEPNLTVFGVGRLETGEVEELALGRLETADERFFSLVACCT